jgi:hypothetical protein
MSTIINSNSGGAATWGSIAGTLSSQTDLNIALSGKQATLLSGTNIKTINGNSLLGSGDLTISGGSGSSGIHTAIPVTQILVGSNTLATTASISCSNLSSIALSANNLLLHPYKPQVTFTCSALYINVGLAVAGSLTRILIYSDNNGNPGTKLYESTDLDCSTTGIKTVVTSFTFTAGTTYWMATYSNSNPTVTAYGIANLIPIFTFGTAMYTGQRNSSTTFGSAPTNYVLASYTNASIPAVFIRV